MFNQGEYTDAIFRSRTWRERATREVKYFLLLYIVHSGDTRTKASYVLPGDWTEI